MNKKTLILSLFVSLFLFSSTIIQRDLFASVASANSSHDVRVFKIESLNQIANPEPNQVIYFFDIDDTLFDSPYMLGSKAWRKYITSATKDDLTENWHDLFSLFIARNHPLETVETLTSKFVRELQMKGYVVFGLTARERKMWYDTPMNDIDLLTVSQLESVGISFNNELQAKAYPNLAANPEYFEGIFFADIEPKGEYLLNLFKDASQLTEKVIFIDDKQSQVESVASAMRQMGISCECYWYTATDDKANKFDPLIANIQLYYFWISDGKRIISDKKALSIAEQYPERNAEYYLQSVLNDAKTKMNKE